MCGICGVVLKPGGDPAWAGPEAIVAMREAMVHRGPDDAGLWVEPAAGVGLGHRRLSIIDLSSRGHQPMVDPATGSVLAYNGEMYNFREVRSRFDRPFASSSDTEVLLYGLAEEGLPFLDRVVGMFAFAFWDPRRRRLLLARDRLGEKPLYWHDGPGLFAFASEPAALLAHPAIEARPDADALAAYLTLGYVPAPRTGFAGIGKLHPGAWATFEGGRATFGRWWTAPVGRRDGSVRGRVRAIRAAVGRAVTERLVSDVPVGAFLSGGLDSSIVAALIHRAKGESLTTFVTGFDVGERSPKYNVDLEVARVVARRIQANQIERMIEGADEALDVLPDVVRHLGEPNDNPTGVATYLLARRIREEGIVVVLSGDGSDEIFGGYDRYRRDRAVEVLRRLAGWVPGRGATRGSRFAKVVHRARSSRVERYVSWWRIFEADEVERLLGVRPTWMEEAVEEALEPLPPGRDGDALWYGDLRMWLAEQSNARVDKLGMAHSIEVRSPFQDHHLVEMASAIPLAARLDPRYGKRLLREAFAGVVPREVLERPKWGWLPPFFHWLRLGRQAGRLDADVGLEAIRETGFLDPEAARAIVRPDAPLERVHLRLWNLLHLAHWSREVLARRPVANLP